jgi:Ser/Thr protein kinase RdoA (MazF antagonist)
MSGSPARLAGELGLRARRIVTLKDVPGENGSWLIEDNGGGRVVLRRYHGGAAPADLAYEHAVLRHLAGQGWVVPEPFGDLIPHQGGWYCLTRYVPGQAVRPEPPAQRRRRGRDLARLHLALRDLGPRLGQRPGWHAQHEGVARHAGLDWAADVAWLTEASQRLGTWAAAATAETGAALAAIGAHELPVMVVHGDFAEWNVHYQRGRLAGVIDFGLTHRDSRPYELAIARTYRAPEATDAYRAELARLGWPLSELEEAAVVPLYRSFRLGMIAWELERGRRTGDCDLAMTERQLARTGMPPP